MPRNPFATAKPKVVQSEPAPAPRVDTLTPLCERAVELYCRNIGAPTIEAHTAARDQWMSDFRAWLSDVRARFNLMGVADGAKWRSEVDGAAAAIGQSDLNDYDPQRRALRQLMNALGI